MAEAMAKPQCGSESEAGEYDLALHVVGLCKTPESQSLTTYFTLLTC